MRGWSLLVVLVGIASSGCAVTGRIGRCPTAKKQRKAKVYDGLMATAAGIIMVANGAKVFSSRCETLHCQRGQRKSSHVTFFAAVVSGFLWNSAFSDDTLDDACTRRADTKSSACHETAAAPGPRTARESDPSPSPAGRPAGAARGRNSSPSPRTRPTAPAALPKKLSRATGYPVRFTLKNGMQVTGTLRLYNGLMAVVATAEGDESVPIYLVTEHQILPRGTNVSSLPATKAPDTDEDEGPKDQPTETDPEVSEEGPDSPVPNEGVENEGEAGASTGEADGPREVPPPGVP